MSVYDVRVGGGSLGLNRFLLPLLPCLAVMSVRGVAALRDRSPLAAVLLGALVAGAVLWSVFVEGAPPLFVLVALGWAGWAAAKGAALLALALAVTGFALGGWLALRLRRPGLGAGVALALPLSAYLALRVLAPGAAAAIAQELMPFTRAVGGAERASPPARSP